jgi:hypothetical protein
MTHEQLQQINAQFEQQYANTFIAEGFAKSYDKDGLYYKHYKVQYLWVGWRDAAKLYLPQKNA